MNMEFLKILIHFHNHIFIFVNHSVVCINFLELLSLFPVVDFINGNDDDE